ncbi:MAG: peptide-methionine (R)-S-oxide reductase MsrB [Verrucomicrobiota bacterium]|jgi:peptide-methionine (R)-S-oxide reductase
MRQPLLITCVATFALMVVSVIAQDPGKKEPMKIQDSAPAQPEAKVEKTEAEWKAQLTPEQYRVLRQAGTEPAHGEVYKQFKQQGGGTYYCAGCGAELFSSKHKFDSHCGWPSFYDASNNKNVILKDDLSHGMIRTEVLCAKCNGHLGHLFKGEGFDTPKDQRYCINGVTLLFVPEGGKTPEVKTPTEPEKK